MNTLISQSNKMRHPKRRIMTKDGPKWETYDYPKHWKQVVEKTALGKNGRGKEIFHSITKHIPA